MSSGVFYLSRRMLGVPANAGLERESMVVNSEAGTRPEGEGMVDVVTFLDSLRKEIEGVGERVKTYKEKLKAVEKILIVVGCDDTRVGVTPDVVEINGKKAMMIYTPKIGGGVPSVEEIQSILDALSDLGCTDNIEVILTQHGSTDEVLGHSHDITCGLRAKYSEIAGSYPELAREFLTLAKDEDVTSETALSGLTERMSNILSELSFKTHLPVRLLKIALLNNGSGDMAENERIVEERTNALFTKAGIAKQIQSARYDHNKKSIIFSNDDVIPAGIEEWTENFQDPQCVVISVGRMASIINDAVVLPSTVGITNNDFSTGAIANQESILDAFAEAWYAAHNHLSAEEGHPHGQNFIQTSACVLLCDGADEVELVRSVLASGEYKKDYAEAFGSFAEGIVTVNLQNGDLNKLA